MGLPCRFQTAYDVDLWPFSVAAAEWRQPERMQRPPRSTVGIQAAAAARLRLRCSKDVVFAGLPLSRLRFHLAGDASVVYSLYELLSEKCIEIQLRDPKDEKKLISIEPRRLRMVGFDADECLLPFLRRSMDGHRLLHEYFALPEKFLFFDVEGLEPLAEAGFGEEAEIVFLFSALNGRSGSRYWNWASTSGHSGWDARRRSISSRRCRSQFFSARRAITTRLFLTIAIQQ